MKSRKSIFIFFLSTALLPLSFLRCSSMKNIGSDAELSETIPEGVDLFVHDAFGGISLATLETGALPFKLMQAALILDFNVRTGLPMSLASWPTIMQSFGISSPDKIEFSDGRTFKWDRSPVGLVRNEISPLLLPLRIDGVNIGCPMCHAGVTYDSVGNPQPTTVRLGSPNTSFNPGRYTETIYRAFKVAVAKEQEVLQLIDSLYPEMGIVERLSLKWFVVSRVRKSIEELEIKLDLPFPFLNGEPGLTNGVAALKYRLGILAKDEMAPEYGFTSIPDLADRRLRSSLLYDGLYFPKDESPFKPADATHIGPDHGARLSDITAFFTVPTMGVDPDDVPNALPKIRKAIADTVWSYRPQAFPGTVRFESAITGQRLFQNRCATCHGSYDGKLKPGALRLKEYPNHFSSLKEIGTDPERVRTAADPRLISALEESRYQEYMTIEPHTGYVAPILTGLWQSAPYLHNGSIPTIWHLLNPRKRPAKFMVGGHGLDFDKLGVRGIDNAGGGYFYVSGYQAWSEPEVYDTTTPGHSNKGHESEFSELTEADKAALIEFLKLL